jgi:hypothetical protein
VAAHRPQVALVEPVSSYGLKKFGPRSADQLQLTVARRR